MALKSVVVVEEDRFAEYEGRLSKGVQEERRRAAQTIQRRARQLIVEWDAIITGDLWRSVHPVFEGLKVSVEASVDYASYVHDGTENMRPRPFLKQATEEATPEVEQRLGRVLGRDYV